MNIRTAVWTAVILSVLAAPTSAQNADPVFTDTVDVEVINVDVVVTGKDGQPIQGLTQADFEILEDGQPVELTNFFAVDEPLARIGEGEMSGADADEPTRPAGPTQGLQLVVLVDNLNIRPQNRKLLFENLRKRLEESAVPGSQIMLVGMNNRLEVAQPFTEDLGQIFAALDGMEKQNTVGTLLDNERRMFMGELSRASVRNMVCNNTRPIGSGAGSGGGSTGTLAGDPMFDTAVQTAQRLAIQIRSLAEQRYQAARGTVASLASFTDTLGGLPGRKALMYLSDGIPMRPSDSLTEAWVGKYEQWYQQNENAIRNCSQYPEAVGDLQRALTASGTNNFDLHSDFNRLTERASDNRVAFYPISNSGRQGEMNSAEIGGGPEGQAIRSAMIAEAQSRHASILQMAEDTGGQAITGNANVGKLLEAVDGDFSAFYSLGYAPPKRKDDDTAFHEIEVKVKHPDAKVRHVKGYTAKTWRDRLGDMTVAAALYGLESNPLGVQIQAGEPVRQGGRFKVPLMVQIPLGGLQMASDGEQYNANVSILVAVLDEKGGFSKPRRFDLPIQIPNAQILQARQQAAGYPIELELKKGIQRVGVGIRDHLALTSSCLGLDFELGSSGGKGKKKKKKGKKG